MNPRVLYRAASYATDARSAADSVISALTPAAWYRNATGITESGGFVSQWDDYSGNGRHLIQSTGTNQPAYSAGVLAFDGADNFMKTLAFTLNAPETVYLIVKQNSWTVNDFILDGNTAYSGAIIQRGVSPAFVLNASTGEVCSNTDLAVDSYGIVCVVISGASSSTRVNNNAKVTTGVSPGAGNMGGLALGAAGGPGGYSHISAKEVIVFAAAHNDATQSSVITALNNALTVF